jgi:hypothetical protein
VLLAEAGLAPGDGLRHLVLGAGPAVALVIGAVHAHPDQFGRISASHESGVGLATSGVTPSSTCLRLGLPPVGADILGGDMPFEWAAERLEVQVAADAAELPRERWGMASIESNSMDSPDETHTPTKVTASVVHLARPR